MIKRNRSSYEGKEIEASYLENKGDSILKIISKLKSILAEKIS